MSANRVGIVVGSRSDIAAAEKAAAVLDELGVGNEIRVISAHRAPDLLGRWVASADERGIGVVIAIAGLAAHLPGVVASQTTLPVIGVPMAGGVSDGSGRWPSRRRCGSPRVISCPGRLLRQAMRSSSSLRRASR